MKARRESTFLQYDWRLDGEYASFTVDLALYDRAPDPAYPILAYVGCSSLDEGSGLGAGDLRRINAFEAKCRRRLDAVLAGMIETDALRQYYFYLPSRSVYEELKQLSEKKPGFSCKVGGKKEEDWASYFRILYPDDAKYQTVRNSEILEQHYDRGDSEVPRRLNLHMGFMNDPARKAFIDAARQEGFAVGEYEDFDSDELPYGVVLHRICAFRKFDIDAVTIQAIRIAERSEGKLLFWDCPIVPGR